MPFPSRRIEPPWPAAALATCLTVAIVLALFGGFQVTPGVPLARPRPPEDVSLVYLELPAASRATAVQTKQFIARTRSAIAAPPAQRAPAPAVGATAPDSGTARADAASARAGSAPREALLSDVRRNGASPTGVPRYVAPLMGPRRAVSVTGRDGMLPKALRDSLVTAAGASIPALARARGTTAAERDEQWRAVARSGAQWRPTIARRATAGGPLRSAIPPGPARRWAAPA